MDLDLLDIVSQRLRSALPAKTAILVGVSGGPDSVALAHVLKRLPFKTVIGHVDHRIRKNSAHDAVFVEGLARRWDMPFKKAEVSVPAHAAHKHLGLEEAARDLRYQALVKMARAAGCRAIATAHTTDDQGETVLMNMLRGAGPAGLAGIPPVRELAPGIVVVRPFLTVTRQQVLAYIQEQHLPYRQDPSNRSLQFTRNRIRSETLPFLESHYPGLKKRLAQMGDIFREEEAFWDAVVTYEFNKTARKDDKKITIDLTQLFGYHKALERRILRHVLKGISFSEIERIVELAHSPKGNLSLQLAGGLHVARKGQQLVIHAMKAL